MPALAELPKALALLVLQHGLRIAMVWLCFEHNPKRSQVWKHGPSVTGAGVTATLMLGSDYPMRAQPELATKRVECCTERKLVYSCHPALGFAIFPLFLSYTWASYWHRAHSVLAGCPHRHAGTMAFRAPIQWDCEPPPPSKP